MPSFVINELNINEENIEDTLFFPDGTIIIDKIYVSYQTASFEPYMRTNDIKLYYVNLDIYNTEELKKIEMDMLILVDDINNTFYIIPKEYIKLKNLTIEKEKNILLYEEEQIEKNNYNEINNYEVSDNIICMEYFNKYILYATYDLEKAYNMLDEQYKQKEFGNIENFKEFVINSNIESALVEKINVSIDSNGNRQCTIIDKNRNNYIFTENEAPMDVTLRFN